MEIPRRRTVYRIAPEVPNRQDFFRCFSYLVQSAEDDGVRSHGWQDSAWIFPKAMRFLEVPEYRPTVLSGLLISVGSRTDNTVMNHAVTGGENTRTLTIVFVSDATSEIVLLRTQTNFRRMLVTVDTIIYKPSSTV